MTTMMTSKSVKYITAGLAAAAVLVLPACSNQVNTTAAEDIPVTKVTVTTSTAPAAEQAPIPTPTIPRASDRYAELDGVVRDAAADAKMMWERATGVKLPSLTVVPEGDPAASRCINDDPLSLMWACDSGVIVYRPAMLKQRMDAGGIGPVMVYTSHEVAHIGMAANGFGAGETSHREEKAAMCGAGAYMRYVVEGKSKEDFTSSRDGALEAGLKSYPLDGSYVSTDVAKDFLAKYREGFDSGQLCIG
ncbi:hypothetical protein B9M81_02000 [Mycobacteroides abscessus]|nr:hypothetical protein BAB77_02015 [Mycobacteroides abscessus]ARQ63042.1 hypothetical protein CAK77_02195 [Mycobacteroides abscessus subsp. massiliense]MBE5447545.1 hypothetical protein [Mycobacteroides abscessus]MBE5514166.1 hypothetical protein [Mycobacteroides abscessus]OTQ98993.1 hypothetical protein B9M86_02005 [Mycobacteroides abscessus]